MKTNKILYQWDAGQKLTDCKGVFVDFVISGEVYRCDVVNGECIVPDELLQHPGKQTAYECMADNTLQEFVFSVVPRPLPPDYVYTPTEKLTFEGLVQKVEDTVADIIRRADSGEFDGYTPVKGKDYFTESEKTEMMQNVSSGAIGEFREVVDSATAGFNKNSSAKTNDYNANAADKMGVYDNNSAEKLKAYNDNHTEKMTAYDANASDKIAEFDAHATELQTEVNNLKAEGTTLREEAGKQEHRIDALMKLNKGQTYDVIEDTTPAHAKTALSGTHYASIEKIGGKSLVWNQLCNPDEFDPMGCTQTESGGVVTISDCVEVNRYKAGFMAVTKGHKYYQTVKIKSDGENPVGFQNYLFLDIYTKTTSAEFIRLSEVAACKEGGNVLVQLFSPNQTSYQIVKNSFMLIDLTLLFGAGNEPTAEQFEQMFTAESYPYNVGEIISSRTETITAGAETITTGFPELRSALAAHDYIDMDGGKVHRKIKSVRIDGDTPIYGVSVDSDANCCRIVFENQLTPGIIGSKNEKVKSNIISDRLATISHADYWDNSLRVSGINVYESLQAVCFRLHDRTDIDTKEKAKAYLTENPMTVYYEAKDDDIADIVIPEQLREWIEVETGSTVVFGDDTRFLIPNTVKFVRKLNEVT